jgi:ferric-dicitrate binding protein FerR (iron transport regulator)
MTRVQELLARHEEDTLNEAELQELIALLEHDPAARRALVAEWSLSSALARLLRKRAGPGEAGWRTHTARHVAARRARQGRRTWTAWWPVAAAAALIIALGTWWTTSGPAPVAVVIIAEGGGPAVGSALHHGAHLTLPAGARVRLRLTSSSELTITEQAELHLHDAQRLTLDRGRAEASVAPRAPGVPPFSISTPHGATRVLGTTFTVSVSAEQTVVLVSHGRVNVERADGASVAANAGERAVLRGDRHPVTLPVWRADQREALLVTGHADLDVGERRLLGLLSGLGFTPRVVLAGAITERDVANARVAVLCNRIALPDLQKRLRHPRCPLVILEQGAWPLYGFPIAAVETATLTAPLTARVTRPHPLTAGLGDPLTLGEGGIRINRGRAGPATLLAQADGGHTLLAVRDPGERLPDGGISPQRRVAFFATTDALPKLTPAGEQALGAAIRWVAELE